MLQHGSLAQSLLQTKPAKIDNAKTSAIPKLKNADQDAGQSTPARSPGKQGMVRPLGPPSRADGFDDFDDWIGFQMDLRLRLMVGCHARHVAKICSLYFWGDGIRDAGRQGPTVASLAQQCQSWEPGAIRSAEMASTLPRIGLWLLALMVALVAADPQPRSSDLMTILTSLEDELPTCAYSCFATHAGSRSCDTVEDFITSDVSKQMPDIYRTPAHLRVEAELLITTTCGTKTRNIQGTIRAIAWTLWAFATTFLTGRLLARSTYFGGMSLGWDDWAIVLSWAVLTGVTIGAELMVVFGLGLDMWTLEDLHINIVLILFYVAEFAYVIESTITKISILLLYLRIFPDPLFRKQVHILMVVMGLFCISFIVTMFTYCVPFDYSWARWDNEKKGTCIDINAQTYTCAGLNIVLDIIIFFIPIPQLLKLDLTWKKKSGIIMTFLVGLFVTICSVIRLQSLIGWTSSTNSTYDFAKLAAWSLIELDAGVICACMPGMAGLFRRLKKRSTDYIRSRSSNNNSLAFGTARGTMGTANGNGPAITKTTIISVKHTRGEDGTASIVSESELELVDRSKGCHNYSSHHYGREMV
ncbi:CFEM domain-containing protein [Seiridium cupressi]